MIGGRRPHPGSQTSGPTRPRRPSALALLPLHGTRPDGRQAGSQRRPDADRPVLRPGARRSCSDGRSPARRRSASACRSARRWRSSARTRSARRRTRPRRSCVSCSWPAPRRCSCRSRSSIAITILLAVVSISYRQVCRAYPNGGGAYVVAKTNLAPVMGLIAAAALLIDYVMTVSVSTAAAITQIQSVICRPPTTSGSRSRSCRSR